MILLKRYAILRKSICTLMVASLFFGLFDVVGAASSSEAQETKFGKGRMLDSYGNKIYFSWIDIGEPVFVYEPTESSNESTIVSDKVMRVDIQRGSYALNGFMWGGLATLGVILVVGAVAKERGGWETDWDRVPPYVAGGALIGMFVGWSKPKYTTVYGFHESDVDDLLENPSHGDLAGRGLILFRFAYSF